MSPVELNNTNMLAPGSDTPQYSAVEQETLNQLADIALPDPIGIWPPSLQVCCIALVFIILILFITWQVRKKIKQNHYRKTAFLELENIVRTSDKMDTNTYVAKINTLLKRCALSAGAPKNNINALTGEELYSYLANVPCKKSIKSNMVLTRYAKHYVHWQVLAYGYGGDKTSADISALTEFAKTWIGLHRYPLITAGTQKAPTPNSSTLLEAKTL